MRRESRKVVRFRPTRRKDAAGPKAPHWQAPAAASLAWRLTDENGNVLACEIQPPAAPAVRQGDNQKRKRVGRTRGAGKAPWTVTLWLNDVVQFTRPCAGGGEAEFVANALMEDQLLGGARPVGRLRQFSRG